MAGGEGNYGASMIRAGSPELKWQKARGTGHRGNYRRALAHRRRRRAGLTWFDADAVHRRNRTAKALIAFGLCLTVAILAWYPFSGIRGKWAFSDMIILGLATSVIWLFGLAIKPSRRALTTANTPARYRS